jgi:hypothetical protein
MFAVRMMQAAIHKVVDVIAMGHGFVPAARTMPVPVAMHLMRAPIRVLIGHLDLMVFFVAAIRMDEAPVMKIIDMILMTNGGMAASGSVLMTHSCLLLPSDYYISSIFYRSIYRVKFESSSVC